MQQYYDRTIGEDDACRMRGILQMRDDGDTKFPVKVVHEYWRTKVILARISPGAGLTDESIFSLLDRSTTIPVPATPGLYEDFKSGKHAIDTQFEVKWRNTWKPATYLGSNHNGIQVRMNGEERDLEPEREMRLQEA